MCGEKRVLGIVKKNCFCYSGFMNTIFKIYIRVLFFLFPIIFIPVVVDGFGLGKNIALAVMAFLALVLWGVNLIIGEEKIVRTNKLLWLFLAVVVWSGVTFFRLGPGTRMMSLMNPMGLGTVVSLFVLFFVFIQNNDKEESEKQFLLLTISGILAGVVSLIVFLLPASKLPLSIPKNNPLISINAAWSLVGSTWAELVLFLFIVLGWLKKLLKKIKEKAEISGYLLEVIAVVFFSLLFLLGIYKIIKAGWVFLDFTSAWMIAVETFKKHPIFGMGIGNFSEAFNLYRPASFNLTKYWSGSFSGSSMGILQIWTELGIVGLLLSFYLVAIVWKLRSTPKFWQLALFLAIFLFLPFNLITAFLLVWMLSNGIAEIKETKLVLNVGEKDFNVMPYLMALLVLVVVGFGSFWTVRIFLGDFYMRKSLVAASKNDGSKTYELQIKAIGFNPYSSSYRQMYSQVNLSLAQTLLSQAEVSDDDKAKASTLIQQAVREGQSAITLSQRNPEHWYNLAGIYKSLAGVVSDDVVGWSYQSYQQTMALSPVNPLYSLDMGGLLYAAGDFEGADRAFEETVKNKSDFANAWYNWANSAKKLNKIDVAVARLEQALKLVPADSGDYETAAKELEVWKKELEEAIKRQQELMKQQADAQAAAAPKQPETLKTQSPLPIMGEEEKVNIPASQLEAPPVIQPTEVVEP